ERQESRSREFSRGEVHRDWVGISSGSGANVGASPPGPLSEKERGKPDDGMTFACGRLPSPGGEGPGGLAGKAVDERFGEVVAQRQDLDAQVRAIFEEVAAHAQIQVGVAGHGAGHIVGAVGAGPAIEHAGAAVTVAVEAALGLALVETGDGGAGAGGQAVKRNGLVQVADSVFKSRERDTRRPVQALGAHQVAGVQREVEAAVVSRDRVGRQRLVGEAAGIQRVAHFAVAPAQLQVADGRNVLNKAFLRNAPPNRRARKEAKLAAWAKLRRAIVAGRSREQVLARKLVVDAPEVAGQSVGSRVEANAAVANRVARVGRRAGVDVLQQVVDVARAPCRQIRVLKLLRRLPRQHREVVLFGNGAVVSQRILNEIGRVVIAR
nr:hypothetical protein [Tanacetum cinerariifolium]